MNHVFTEQKGLHYNGLALTAYQALRRLYVKWGLYTLLCAALVAPIALASSNFWPVWLVGSIGVGIFAAWIPAVRRSLGFIAVSTAGTRQLCADNNLTYLGSHKMRFDPHDAFQPAIRGAGLAEWAEAAFRGTWCGHEFTSYIYTYRHPLSYRLSRAAIRVYEVQLRKPMPHIFIANRRQIGRARSTGIPRHFDDNQRIGLEGGFSKDFAVYTNRRTTTEALSILAPNFMAILQDHNTNYDVEFIGNKMYLYSGDYTAEASEMKRAFETLRKMLAYLDHKQRSWRLVLPGNKYPFLVSRVGFGSFDIGGKYFNQSLFFIAFYAIWGAFKLWTSQRIFGHAVLYVLISIYVVVLTALIAVLVVFRMQHNKNLRYEKLHTS